MGIKKCTRCKTVKKLAEFGKRKDRKSGYVSWCKKCKAEYQLEYQKDNRDERRAYHRKWHKENIGKERKRLRDYYNKDLERSRKMNRKKAIRYFSKPKNIISGRISAAIRKSLQVGKNNIRWEKLTGYDLKAITSHLEGLFKPGMTWKNIGKWHIDHIIPISLWEFKTPEDREFKQCWALVNLQPLWATDNMSKGARIQEGKIIKINE